MGSKIVYTKTYNPKFNRQVERFNPTILAALRHYIINHPKEWDQFTDALTFSYNTQVLRITKLEPLELVLSRTPPYLALNSEQKLEDTITTYVHFKLLNHFKTLMNRSRTSMDVTRKSDKRHFNETVKIPKQIVAIGSQVYVWKEHFGTFKRRQKLALTVTGLYVVTDANDKTRFIEL